jgi:hypothetical protein
MRMLLQKRLQKLWTLTLDQVQTDLELVKPTFIDCEV